MQSLKKHIDEIPDFPKEGILFRDATPLLKSQFHQTIDAMSSLLSSDEWNDVDYVAGIDARGFIYGSALAYKNNKGFIKIRKSGKLPNAAEKIDYGLEYGKDSLEMQSGNGGNVLIVDDLLATGGSLKAAGELCMNTGHNIAGFCVLINLETLNDFEFNGLKARYVLSY